MQTKDNNKISDEINLHMVTMSETPATHQIWKTDWKKAEQQKQLSDIEMQDLSGNLSQDEPKVQI